MTPIGHDIARPLVDGLRNRVVCRDDAARRLMPGALTSVRDAVRAAVAPGPAETTWSMAGPIPGDPDWAGGTVFVDRRETRVEASPTEVFRAVCRIGGRNGWYGADWLWRLRGLLDRLVGGPGLRRGRRDPEQVAFGEALDFWRVVGIDPGRTLELQAEMRLPGTAQLDFAVAPAAEGSGGARLVQTARFKPRGLAGLLYWYGVSPFHAIVFGRMLDGIRRAAESGTE